MPTALRDGSLLPRVSHQRNSRSDAKQQSVAPQVCERADVGLAEATAIRQSWAWSKFSRPARSLGANVGATRANNLPGRRMDTDRRLTITPSRGPIRTTLNA
jgi:hypothetical protein